MPFKGAARSRVKRAEPEHVEQVLFFKHVAMDKRTRDLPITATANGGQRHKAVAAKLKASGVKAGVPDILCFAPGRGDGIHEAGPRVGLAIEMKVKPNRTTLMQDEWLERLWGCGWRVEVCYSADEAWATLCHYLSIAP